MKNIPTFNEFVNESYTEELNEGTSKENKFVKELWKELKDEQDVSKKRVEEYVHSELNSGDNQEPSVEYFWEWWSAQESVNEAYTTKWHYTLASIQDEIRNSEEAEDWPEVMDMWEIQSKAIIKHIGGNEKSILAEQSEGEDGHAFLTALYGDDGWVFNGFEGLTGKQSKVASTMMAEWDANFFAGTHEGIKYVLIDDRDQYAGNIMNIYVTIKDIVKFSKSLGL